MTMHATFIACEHGQPRLFLPHMKQNMKATTSTVESIDACCPCGSAHKVRGREDR